jgi:hypothetical protein
MAASAPDSDPAMSDDRAVSANACAASISVATDAS